MTEAEWLASRHPEKMLEELQYLEKNRKSRLYAVACCQRLLRLDGLPRELIRRAVETAERFADGRVNRRELLEARLTPREVDLFESHPSCLAVDQAVSDLCRVGYVSLRDVSLSAARAMAHTDPELVFVSQHYGYLGKPVSRAECAAQCDFLRDLFGPSPFRRVTVDPSWLAWSGGMIARLAEAIYEDRAYDRLPILADALEEAGCTDADILGHCRGGGNHVQGCWPVDLVLGKE
jgi:hypothetical protein